MARITIGGSNRFLEDHSSFDAFWLEYHRVRFEPKYKGVSTGFEAYRDFVSIEPRCFIRAAFAWSDTSQGAEFWVAINAL